MDMLIRCVAFPDNNPIFNKSYILQIIIFGINVLGTITLVRSREISLTIVILTFDLYEAAFQEVALREPALSAAVIH